MLYMLCYGYKKTLPQPKICFICQALIFIENNFIILLVTLIGVDIGTNTQNQISRFANYLRNLLPCADLGVTDLVAKAMGRLALVSGTFTAVFVELEVKRALEWLTIERTESKRYAAVSVPLLLC